MCERKKFESSPSVKEPTFYAEVRLIASWQKVEQKNVANHEAALCEPFRLTRQTS